MCAPHVPSGIEIWTVQHETDKPRLVTTQPLHIDARKYRAEFLIAQNALVELFDHGFDVFTSTQLLIKGWHFQCRAHTSSVCVLLLASLANPASECSARTVTFGR